MAESAPGDPARRNVFRRIAGRPMVFLRVHAFATGQQLVFHGQPGLGLQHSSGRMANPILAHRPREAEPRPAVHDQDSHKPCRRECRLVAGTVLWPLDEKGGAMTRALLLAIMFLASSARAHVGSPDIFYDGL